jgi:hypothetical protein
MTDTVLDTASTDASLTFGGNSNPGTIDAVPENGSFDTTIDHDWFAVNLVAGHDYEFSAQSATIGLNDVAIVLRNSSGTVLNSPGIFENGFTYTATSSGTGYLDISAGRNFPSQTGNYAIFAYDDGADTALDTTSTTATLTMNWTTTGRIDRMPESGSFDASLDHDWFAVNLIAGHDYEFSALGITGGLNDIAIDLSVCPESYA